MIQARAEALPFPTRSFDAVTLTTVLEFVSDPARVLREAFRVCRGQLVLGVLNRFSILYLCKRLKGILVKTSYDEARFQSVRSLKHLIEAVAPDFVVRYKTTLVPEPVSGPGFWLEKQLTKWGYPFGGFLVMSISR